MRWASLSLAEMIEDLYMVNTTTLKLMISGDNQVYFTRYFDNNLWYRVGYAVDGELADPVYDNFEFPVPVADTQGATFLAQDKAILFMRYIRKHMEMLEKAKAELSDA